MGVKSQFVLTGNIYDIYPVPHPGTDAMSTGVLETLLTTILVSSGYKSFYKFEPFYLTPLFISPDQQARLDAAPKSPPKDGEAVSESVGVANLDRENIALCSESTMDLSALTSFAEQLSIAKEPAALLINYSSRIPKLCPDSEAFYYELFRLSLKSVAANGRFNFIIWALDKDNDLPPWYANHRIMTLPIPKPDHDIRRRIIQTAGQSISGYKKLETTNPEEHHNLVNRFVDQTGGLYASEIVSIARFAALDRLDFTRINEAVRHYKLGIPDNPWAKLDSATILQGEEILSKRVIGQSQAVSHSLDIIKRSIYDLSGAQFSSHVQKPKGVLFFAGPTGVGKTELAKGITELIFGSPENYVRFDMSEFNQAHADQRLMGAPPGYVGYDVGGELTNAIKQKPFTLLLLDEIEKAHPRIMDIFLQVLDDGRLTSGRGETVYFTDAIIVFTSNLGVYKETATGERVSLVTPDMDFAQVQSEIKKAIEDFFRFTLHRPEMLNRIGKNIVVFDFIRAENALKIYEKMIANVLLRLADAHKIQLELEDGGKRILGQLVTKDLSMGGRGIGNNLEELFVNPLARELFALAPSPGDKILCKIAPGILGSGITLALKIKRVKK
jgi:ATP-dependent Clp protease ATP-binding subunit ClpA